MNRDLFLAILAMDSYNRGYGAGISGLKVRDTNPDGTPKTVKIGNAAIIDDKGDAAAQAAGFYAIAYDLSHAGIEGLDGTVISYRGTDGLSDFWAYGIGVGQPFALTGGLTDQARLTIGFYRAVAGENADPFAADITTTGHSLGGGLAGFVSMLSGVPAVMFDHIPFGWAAADTLADCWPIAA